MYKQESEKVPARVVILISPVTIASYFCLQHHI
jgi:hypothetical protein